MALTLVVSAVNQGSTVAGQTEPFLIAITNTSASSVTLSNLVVSGPVGVTVGQPSYLVPNMPVGLGNPTIIASGTNYYAFQAVFQSPAAAGPSPANPGGASPAPAAATPYANFTLQVQAQASDGSVASASLMVPVLSAIPPFPLPQGGALQFGQGGNLITLTMLGAL